MKDTGTPIPGLGGQAVDVLVERTTQRQRDGLLAALLGVLAVGLHLGFGDIASDALVRLPGWAAITVLIVMALTLVWRRQRPETVMTVVGLLTAAYYLTGQSSPAAVVLLTFALYAITAFGEERVEGWMSLLACWFFMTLSFLLGGGLPAVVSSSYVLSGFIFTVAWALGVQTRARLELTDELRRRNAQLAVLRERERDELVTGERRRIARELHDVISHTVSVVVVQAAAARRVADRDQAAVVDALEAIERSARDAMGELRRMLGLLRDEDAGTPPQPAPDHTSLAELVDELRATGMPVRVEGRLPGGASSGVALTVHRVVQEGLTNVLRHAEDVEDVLVRLEQAPGTLEVEVVDDGRPAGFTSGAGAGLVGVRERVALHGGSVDAGPMTGGRGYRLQVRIPTKVTAP